MRMPYGCTCQDERCCRRVEAVVELVRSTAEQQTPPRSGSINRYLTARLSARATLSAAVSVNQAYVACRKSGGVRVLD